MTSSIIIGNFPSCQSGPGEHKQIWRQPAAVLCVPSLQLLAYGLLLCKCDRAKSASAFTSKSNEGIVLRRLMKNKVARPPLPEPSFGVSVIAHYDSWWSHKEIRNSVTPRTCYYTASTPGFLGLQPSNLLAGSLQFTFSLSGFYYFL